MTIGISKIMVGIDGSEESVNAAMLLLLQRDIMQN
jgi:hypothetical protein